MKGKKKDGMKLHAFFLGIMQCLMFYHSPWNASRRCFRDKKSMGGERSMSDG